MYRRSLICLLFVCSVGWASAVKPPRGVQLNYAHPLSRGLVARWLMNEGSGTLVNDLSGNGNTGTCMGDAHFVPGQFGSCLSFDGTGDYVLTTDAFQFGSNNFSIGMWIKTTTTATGVRICGTVDIGTNTIISLELNTAFDESSSVGDTLLHLRADGGHRLNNAMNTNIYDDNWHHIVGVKQGTESYIYVDGISQVLHAGIHAVAAGDTFNTEYPIALGAWNLRGVKGSYADAEIDDVQIYNRALSAEEIEQLYRDPFCMFGQEDVTQMVAEAGEPSPAGRTQVIFISAMPTLLIVTSVVGAFFCCGKRLRNTITTNRSLT